jgi:hypothetical protein
LYLVTCIFSFVLVEVVIPWKSNSHNCEILCLNLSHDARPNNFDILLILSLAPFTFVI